jgi:hypothetical protein
MRPVAFAPEARNRTARVLLDVQDGGFAVLLDGIVVVWSADPAEAMEVFRLIRDTAERYG